MNKLGARLLPAAIGLAAIIMLPAAAWATEGYFQLGYSPVQNGVGGAGVANSEDAMSMALNPAGIVGIGRAVPDGCRPVHALSRLFVDGYGFRRAGHRHRFGESSNNLFLMPNMAYSQPLDANSAVGVALYGNGGMNTSYKGVTNKFRAHAPVPVSSAAATAGVDLMQMFLSADYARRIGKFSFGIAPTLALQTFEAKGLSRLRPSLGQFVEPDQQRL